MKSRKQKSARAAEIIGTTASILGAFFLAFGRGEGFVAFAAANLAFGFYALALRLRGLLITQAVLASSSAIGIFRWLSNF